MFCAAPWKTCNCPWFNYQHIGDEDSLEYGSAPDEPEDSGDSTRQNKRTVTASHRRPAIPIDQHDESDDGDGTRKHSEQKTTYPPSKPTVGRTATYVY
jgi:hypothetical protein